MLAGSIAGGAGVVALGAGTVFELQAQSESALYNGDPAKLGSSSHAQQVGAAAVAHAQLATGLFIGGGVLAVAGGVLLLVGHGQAARASGPDAALSVAPVPGGAMVVAAGRLPFLAPRRISPGGALPSAIRPAGGRRATHLAPGRPGGAMEPTRSLVRGRTRTVPVLWATVLVLVGACALPTIGHHADGGEDGGATCGVAPVSSCGTCDDGIACDDGTAACLGGRCLCGGSRCLAGCLVEGTVFAADEEESVGPLPGLQPGAVDDPVLAVRRGHALRGGGVQREGLRRRLPHRRGAPRRRRPRPRRPLPALRRARRHRRLDRGRRRHRLPRRREPLHLGPVRLGHLRARGGGRRHALRRARGLRRSGPLQRPLPHPGRGGRRRRPEPGQRLPALRHHAEPHHLVARPRGDRLRRRGPHLRRRRPLRRRVRDPGTFHDDGAPNPETPCQVCRAKSATAAWSAAANGARCGADLCGDWSDCAFPDACAGDGEQTRGCAPLVCAAGTCVSERAHLQARACIRGTQDGAACDDGNACTADDRCGGGACVGQAYTCPDNPCQKSVACDGQGGCLGTPKRDGTHCDDGDPCTRDDVCTDGVCGGRAYSCPAPTECEVAVTCDGKGKCHHLRAPAGTACDDGDPCTEGDRCDLRPCAGEAYRCPDARPGTCVQAIACDGGGGCVSTLAPDGAPCAPATCSDGACRRWGVRRLRRRGGTGGLLLVGHRHLHRSRRRHLLLAPAGIFIGGGLLAATRVGLFPAGYGQIGQGAAKPAVAPAHDPPRLSASDCPGIVIRLQNH